MAALAQLSLDLAAFYMPLEPGGEVLPACFSPRYPPKPETLNPRKKGGSFSLKCKESQTPKCLKDP